MRVEVLQNIAYYLSEIDKLELDLSQFMDSNQFQAEPNHCIINLLDYSKSIDLVVMRKINLRFQELNLTLVVISDINWGKPLKDEFVLLPTLVEAKDYLLFDQLQKDLLE